MTNRFERAYTMTDYYDGPRGGIADFEGAPHLYRSLWLDHPDDDDDGRFELSPVAPEVLELALEDWAIWRRWEEAFYAGHAGRETHPALPRDRARHEALTAALEGRLAIDPERTVVARGEFRFLGGVPGRVPGPWPELEVRWTRVT